MLQDVLQFCTQQPIPYETCAFLVWQPGGQVAHVKPEPGYAMVLQKAINLTPAAGSGEPWGATGNAGTSNALQCCQGSSPVLSVCIHGMLLIPVHVACLDVAVAWVQT